MTDDGRLKEFSWVDVGSEGFGVFAKHKFRCSVCGYQMTSRKVPNVFCPECAKVRAEKFEELKAKFGK